MGEVLKIIILLYLNGDLTILELTLSKDFFSSNI